jgi:rare lipoprotein A
MLGALALSAGLALPSTAAADSASAGTGGTPSGGTAAPAADAITLTVAGGALVDRTVRVTGTVPRGLAGRAVLVQRGTGGGWTTVARVATTRQGLFSARWRSHRSGRFVLRAIAERAVVRAGSAAPSSPGLARVTVYPSAIATWYGPRSTRVETTACGVRLTRSTLGVAHRTLPSGTRVELYYRGRSIVVPVIDRGPYANGADWDLAVGTADALGFTDAGLDRIGALPLR